VKSQKYKSPLREWLEAIVIAVALAFLIKHFVLELVVVDGQSMYPTLEDRDRLVVTKFQYYFDQPDYSDIVILNHNGTVEFVKRIAAKEGDQIEIMDSTVYRNGTPLEEPYINGEAYKDYPATSVPQDHYFVLGDNRSNSKDSRYSDVGFIHEEDILGKVALRLYPFDQIGWIK